eukprot:TRINITY_DN5713_c1_g1_i1.p5 TRINITY_DN5713_c1_g1~~TRINITY_DN5713_c1_g1_i1.p5  ORF type:complete len:169 (+),score=22.61 TRINITY_DN5713_c1_g1_i1:103-609(+)
MVTPSRVAGTLQEEQLVQQRQQILIQQDMAYVSYPNVDQPFQNLQDVVTRLLPFHIFNSVEGEDADAEECEEEGGILITGRRDAWNRMVLERVADYCRKLEKFQSSIQQLEQQQNDVHCFNKSDEYLIERLVCEQQKQDISILRQNIGQMQQQALQLEKQQLSQQQNK